MQNSSLSHMSEFRHISNVESLSKQALFIENTEEAGSVLLKRNSIEVRVTTCLNTSEPNATLYRRKTDI